jgi:putative CocE/NonD family hydrolase
MTASEEDSQPFHEVKMRFDVPVAMRDGVKLSADIYLPDAPGPFPAVLSRTPYDNSTDVHVDLGLFYARRGYAYVAQDCRGRYDSEGTFYAYTADAEDGFDTQEWVGGQAWCNGKIGTVGASYGGHTQWMPAPLGSKYLKAMVPRVTPSDIWIEDAYAGGVFRLALGLFWGLRNHGRVGQNARVHDWEQVFRSLPLIEADRQHGRDVKFYQDWVRHSTYDDYWRKLSNLDSYPKIDTPALHMGGWFDAYTGGALINFNGMIQQGKTAEARRGQKIVIGPWRHALSASTRLGQLDFGPQSMLDLTALELRWFDYWLKGIDNGIMDEPPIQVFVMGENVWRDEHEWPLARTQYASYHLHSGGGAGRLISDGSLSLEPPRDEPMDGYVYDPENPVPTWGGTFHDDTVMKVGPWDQRPIEAREDVLVFTGPVLEQDTEVTGAVVAKIYASSSAPDTDFTARLVDVYPDGRAMYVCEGVVRARYRESNEHPTMMEQGKVYEFTIEMEVTCNLFKQGHRIRLDISSSNFPRNDRNLNTGHRIGMDAEMRVAEQVIYHTAEYPSHVILPIIPRTPVE